jgi:hypothetical protein
VSLLSPLATDLRRLSRCDGDAQRCDAKHPCTPCSEDGVFDCVYDQSRDIRGIREEPPAAAQSLLSFKGEPSPRSSTSPPANNEDFPVSSPCIASSDTDRSVLSSTDTNLSHVSPENSRFPESNTLDEFELPTLRERSILETELVPFRGGSSKPHQPAMVSTFSFLQSLLLSSIPRLLHTPLSSLGPERLQVSYTTSSERDLTLCVFPFFGCRTQTSRELTTSVQPPCGAPPFETVWDLSHRS